MNCPYCNKRIDGFTGLQEVTKFNKHLPKCRKNPNNITLSDGKRSATTPIKPQTIQDALAIRAESGQ